MEYPKVFKKTCANNDCFGEVASGKFCPNCTLKEALNTRKQKAKKWQLKPSRVPVSKKTNLEKAISKAQRGEVSAEKLFEKALKIWSVIVRGTEDYTACSTCSCPPMKTRGNGIFGAHAGHYLDKANHWKLALDTMNGLPQCKTCNADFIHNPKRIELIKIEMRHAMVLRHGQEAVISLEERGHKFRIDVKQGRENSKPRTHDPMAAIHQRPTDIEWLQEAIARLQHIKKSNNI